MIKINMLKAIARLLDKLEDRVRNWLSSHPILYAFIGGTGVVLFWRGIWHTADFLTERLIEGIPRDETIDLIFPFWWDGMFSLVTGSFLLLVTGLMVSSFIGNEIIISGVRGEEKLADKTKEELEKELDASKLIKKQLQEISSRLDRIDKKLNSRKTASQSLKRNQF